MPATEPEQMHGLFEQAFNAGDIDALMALYEPDAALVPQPGAIAEGTDAIRPVKPDTIAKSLAIGNPADGPYALDLARRSSGTIESVTDDEIREGIRLLAQTTGIFTETAGGVTTAVLAKLAQRGDIDPDERVVAYITGEGLKTLDAVRGTFEAWEIDPSVEAFEAANERVSALA